MYLSKALNGAARSPAEADAARMILASVQAGQASYPLSTAHLHETWKRRRADSRLPLARTMALISKHHAIAPPWQLLPAELDRALHARFGRAARDSAAMNAANSSESSGNSALWPTPIRYDRRAAMAAACARRVASSGSARSP